MLKFFSTDSLKEPILLPSFFFFISQQRLSSERHSLDLWCSAKSSVTVALQIFLYVSKRINNQKWALWTTEQYEHKRPRLRRVRSPASTWWLVITINAGICDCSFAGFNVSLLDKCVKDSCRTTYFFLSCLHYLDKPIQVSYFITLSSSTHRLAGEGLINGSCKHSWSTCRQVHDNSS